MIVARGATTGEPDLERAGLSPAASLFHSLSDPTRLAILRHLSVGEHRVVDLTAHLGLAQSTVSKHLACLRDCGLVTSRPEGRASLFSLTTHRELIDLLAAAERLLALTDDAVDHCSTYGESSRSTARRGAANRSAANRSAANRSVANRSVANRAHTQAKR